MVQQKQHLDSRFSSASFHAITLHPGFGLGSKEYLRRDRLLDNISRARDKNSVTIVLGPPGSGRTTIARQWISEFEEPTQVIYVRRPVDVDLNAYSAPSPFGAAIADFLNQMAVREDQVDLDRVQQLMNRALELSTQYPSRIVIDDLEILQLQAMERLLPLLGETMQTYNGPQFLMISRAVSTIMMAALRKVGRIHVVAAQLLAVDADETAELHKIGRFGDLSLEEIQAARVANGGWIAGMMNTQAKGTPPITSNEEFDHMVLNEFVQTLPPAMQLVLTTSAHVPTLSKPLWDELVSKTGANQKMGGLLFSMIPVVHKNETFELSLALRQSLVRMTNFIVEADKLQESLGHVLEWYVRHNDLTSAKEMVAANQMEADYVRLVKPLAAVQARAENWQVIADMMEPLSVESIEPDPDIAFWYTYALGSAERWSEMVDIFRRLTKSWSESGSDLVRGRHFLLKGWIYQSVGRIKQALESFERSYETLPESAYQERLHAAASASQAISHANLDADISEWQRRSANELSQLPPKQAWWHSHAGPQEMGNIASQGRLELAYRLATRQVESLRQTYPELAWRYLLLVAEIDFERGNMDSARRLLTTAQPLLKDQAQRNAALIVEAQLLAAQNEHEASQNLMTTLAFPAGQGMATAYRLKSYQAHLSLNQGDPETANQLLNTTPRPDDDWPKQFSDHHPVGIMARIRAMSGEYEEATELLESVIEEATKRGNRQLQLRAHSMLAYIYNLQGKLQERDVQVQLAHKADEGAGFYQAFVFHGEDIREYEPGTQYAKNQLTSIAEHMAPHEVSDVEPLLTRREIELLVEVAKGHSNQMVATNMYISLSTVKNHLSNIFNKLGVANRNSAVAKAKHTGLIQ